MSTGNLIVLIMYGVGLILGIASLLMKYTGLPENYDTEPLLAFGLFLLAVAGMTSMIRARTRTEVAAM